MPNKILHLISQAHLDPVWLWPLRDGVAEALTTMQSAIDRADETPDFKFTRSSACTYKWARDMDPVLFDSIRQLVKMNRWEVIGGWVEQPDCNLPSAESFIRQGLYGKAFFNKEFGAKGRTTIGYNPDSFGHCGGLPQLLNHTDFDGYAFMRPQPWDNPKLPILFWWESKDGSRVLTCRIPVQYSQSYAISKEELETVVREAAKNNFVDGINHGVMWFGVGNHGGGPTREHIAVIKELQKDASLPEIRFSTVRDFMAEVRKSPESGNLKIIREELGFLFPGCYSATGEVKQLHRWSEKALFGAETLDLLANWKSSVPRALAEAWWHLLFNQFHDILAGTCSYLPQEETRSRFGSTLTTAREHRMKAVYKLARKVDTRSEKGSVLFAVNPLPWQRKALVQLDTFIEPNGREEIIGLETKSGRKVPIQWMQSDSNFGPWGLKWGKLTTVVNLPAGGYQVFRTVTKPVVKSSVDPSSDKDEKNPQFWVQKNDSRKAEALLSKEPALLKWSPDGVGQLLAHQVGTVVVRDEGNTWGFGIKAYNDVIGQPEILEKEVIESGALVSVVRQKSRWQSSEIWMDVITYTHTPTLEIRFRFNWQEKRQQLKLVIPTRLRRTRTIAKMPAERVVRPTDGREYPCHDWVSLEGTLRGKPVYLGLMNDSSYSYSGKAGQLSMVLARGVPYAEHPPFEYKDVRNVAFLDQGWHERRFWITAAPGQTNGDALERESQEWQIPAEHMLDNPHPGTEPWKRSLFQLQPKNIQVMALKAAENGKGTVLRILETGGSNARVKIQFNGRQYTGSINAHAVATFLLHEKDGKLQPLNGLEKKL
ncbi:MAG: glycoside hydrolase family 38 C-terminal domain-containing protein [Puniceicoccaceae bacterium]